MCGEAVMNGSAAAVAYLILAVFLGGVAIGVVAAWKQPPYESGTISSTKHCSLGTARTSAHCIAYRQPPSTA